MKRVKHDYFELNFLRENEIQKKKSSFPTYICLQDNILCKFISYLGAVCIHVSRTVFISEFYDSRMPERRRDLPLAAVTCLLWVDVRPKILVLNREKWIFWSKHIDSTLSSDLLVLLFTEAHGDLWETHIECITRKTISPCRVTCVLCLQTGAAKFEGLPRLKRR